MKTTNRAFILGSAALMLSAGGALAERGSDGELRLMFWQAPTTMNVYLSTGTKELTVASLVLEPLAAFAPDGSIFPRLAVDVPTLENGGISEDLTSITWKLKPGVKWSDGSDFTAEDVKFTADYCMDPNGGCAQGQKFDGVKEVVVVDPLTVRIDFDGPRPYAYSAFVGSQSPVLQKAQFENCAGANASSCTQQNFNPIGTGPFRITSFRTNDSATYEANPEYREADKPYFASVAVKGGGDSMAAARTVMETGEYDYAWNMQIAPEIMAQMITQGKGVFDTAFGNSVEMIYVNSTDPSSSLGPDDRSTVKHPHPFLTDPRVRLALSKAIDRTLLNEIGYGDTGRPTCDIIPEPDLYAPHNTSCIEQDVEGAKALLEEAGWTVGSDGIREKDGMKLHMLFQTSVNAVRQDFQSLIKQWWQDVGVSTELKSIDASVFFGGDAGSPDTLLKFYADVEMFTSLADGTDPGAYLAEKICSEVPGPDTQWQGSNYTRACMPDYDALIVKLGETADPAERGELSKQLNNMLTVENNWILPLVARGRVSARSNSIGNTEMNAWDSELWNVANWTRVD